jgi:hypothetical protein
MFKRSTTTVVAAATLASAAAAQVAPQYNFYPDGGNVMQIALAPATALNANVNALFYADAAAQQIVTTAPVASLSFNSTTSNLTWPHTVIAGAFMSSGTQVNAEDNITTAKFFDPIGLFAYPRYAANNRTAPTNATNENDWLGVFVADSSNNQIRFINFLRGSNVTLVAGNADASSGTADGQGTDAHLANPYLGDAGVLSLPNPTWVLLWADYGNNCVRQGVPINGLSGSTLVLQNMILDVTTFAGSCGSSASSATGLTDGAAVFNEPTSVAGNPDLVFVTDRRVSMITPIYPAEARFLTALTERGTDSFTGITQQSMSTSDTTSTVTLYVGGRYRVALVTVPLRQDPVSRNVTLTANATVTNYSNVAGNAATIGAPLFVTLPDFRTAAVIGSNKQVFVYCCLAAPTTTTTTPSTTAANATINTTASGNNSGNATTLVKITTAAPASAVGQSLIGAAAAIAIVLAAW